MSTFFLDYEGGNNANDGTSFANRFKDITNGATAARIAPNDTIRIMGSPAPTSLGINATWTNKSTTVTLASALNALITNCDTAWTASANVTSTADVGTYRTSTGSAKHVIAAGFTTGLAAYFATGTLDLSAYQGITLWVQVTVKTLAAGELSIRLCSDVAGVTTVDNLALPAISQTGQWVPVYINKGSALGASIQSIALYGDTDNGAITVFLDNISTVKATGNDALTLQSLIGKNTASEYWWALRSINGTTLTLDSNPQTAVATAGRGYYGVTATVLTYKKETIKTDLVAATSTLVQAVQDSGSAGNLITFSGGWNRTDMTTQTLDTFFDGQSGFGYGLTVNAKTFIKFDNLYAVRYDRGFTLDGNNNDHGKIYGGHCLTGIRLACDTLTATELHAWGCYNAGFLNVNGSDWTITLMRAISCAASGVSSGWVLASTAATGLWNIGTLECSNSVFYGLTGGVGVNPSMVKIDTLTVNDNAQSGFFPNGQMNGWIIGILNANSNGATGMRLGSMRGDLLVGALNAASNGTYGLDMTPLESGALVTIQSLVTTGNTSGAVHTSLIEGLCRILKSSMAEATKLVTDSAGYGTGSLSFQNFNLTSGDHRTYLIGGGAVTGLGTIFSEGSVRHTASGLAWKLSPQTTIYITPTFPLVMALAKIACKASALVTVKCFMRRTNTGLTGTLRCRGGQIGGVAADVTASISAAADTWQEVTITFTPNEIGVVEIDVACYATSTTYSLYCDDMTISQA